ncbi:hypothetical protein RvY_18366 [Ramazzottius varieornatus]|uniref:Uncharacterized protein n=1 Tax=Ramazzottius varieornatus TaxID=947166 RepID=A0A1D1WB53_RAMVA|nr:hypothetical protein RvY_18366 [Ramazzottius varieornatus]
MANHRGHGSASAAPRGAVLIQQPSQPNAQQADVMKTYVNAGRPDVKMNFRSNGPPHKPFYRNRLGDRAPFHYNAHNHIKNHRSNDRKPGNNASDQRQGPKGRNSKKAPGSYVGRNHSGSGGNRHNEHSGGGHYRGRHGGGYRGRGNGHWGHGGGGHGKHGWHMREYGRTGNPRSEHDGNNDNEVNLPYDDAEGPNQEPDSA